MADRPGSEASRDEEEEADDRKRHKLWAWFPHEKMIDIFNIFIANEVSRGVEFSHPTLNSPEFDGKGETEVS